MFSLSSKRRGAVLNIAVSLALATGGFLLVTGPSESRASAEPSYDPTPQARCNASSKPEKGRQGRVSAKEYESGRAAKGYTCNAKQVSHFGDSGGFKVYRYVDDAGNVCAIYDSTLLLPIDVPYNVGASTGLGTVVLDMNNPKEPKKVANLVSGAMQSPHESLYLNNKRGLLAAAVGNPATAPGFVDIYDLSEDCRDPQLKSSTPLGLLGHESGFARDGNTFYVASTSGNTLSAIDVSNPSSPSIVATKFGVNYHGLRLSRDGETMYASDIGEPQPLGPIATRGLAVLDVSEIQNREPDPQFEEISTLGWSQGSIPQAADPVKINGRKYLVQTDEFANFVLGPEILLGAGYQAKAPVGAARIIDVENPAEPKVVANMRLAVHQLKNRDSAQKNDPGASLPVQGYAGHYCSVPQYKNPGIVACSMIASGLRVFDISNPKKPIEVAYFNQPLMPGGIKAPREGAHAMSAPAYDLKRRTVWYTDGNTGFYAVKLAKKVVPKKYWK